MDIHPPFLDRDKRQPLVISHAVASVACHNITDMRHLNLSTLLLKHLSSHRRTPALECLKFSTPETNTLAG